MNKIQSEPEQTDLSTIVDKVYKELTSSIRTGGDYSKVSRAISDRLCIVIGYIDRGPCSNCSGDDGPKELYTKANQSKIIKAREIVERLTKCKVCVDLIYGEMGHCSLEIIASHK